MKDKIFLDSNIFLLKKESKINFRCVNLEIATLRHFFNFCIEKGYIDKNLCAGVKKLNELSRLKTLSDSDIQKLIDGATNKLARDLITFLIYTGCRKGEALNLKWDDVWGEEINISYLRPYIQQKNMHLVWARCLPANPEHAY